MAGTPGTFRFPEVAASPPAPPAGYALLYIKTDNVLYLKDSSGTEIALGSASSITALIGDVTATGPGIASATVNSVGGSSAVNIHSAELAANAATAINTPNTIVERDASGNFSASTITAALTGAASANVLKAGDTMTGPLVINVASLAALRLGTNTFIVDTTNNKIGINKTTPAEALDVVGNGAFSGTLSASNLSGTNTGDVTLNAVGSVPNANGASLSGQALTLQPADGTHPGLVTTLSQTIAGIKTLLAQLLISDTTESTNKDTGSIVTEGGLGVEKNINAGGNINAVGTVTGSNLSGTNTGDVTKTDTDSIALSISGQDLSADLKLSSDAADAGNIKANTTVHTGAGAGLHVEIPFDVPVQIGTSNSPGASSKTALSDHIHAHGNQSNGSLHAAVTTSINGFMSAADKTKLDAISGSNTGDVTLTAVGSTPNADGASLTGQALTLQPADRTHPGVLSEVAQGIGGDKDFFGNTTFDGNLIINRSLTFTPAVDAILSGSNTDILLHAQDYIIFTNAGLLSIASIFNTSIAAGHRINLVNKTGGSITLVNNYGTIPGTSAGITTSFGTNLVLPNNGDAQLIYDTTGTPTWNLQNGAFIVQLNNALMVSGILPVANGGTNSNTALNNKRIMTSVAGAVVEAAALTDGALLIGSTGNSPVAANIAGTSNQVNVTNAPGSITLSTPQDIAPASKPTFAGENLTDRLELTEQVAPVTPAATKLDIFAEASNGFTRIRTLDSTGNISTILRDTIFVAKNTSGSSMSVGQAVYVTGSDSATGVVTISLAKADSSLTVPAFGLVIDAAANNAFTRVISTGIINNINTSAFSDGQRLYLSATTAGGLTATKPISPSSIWQRIGVVIKAHATLGSIEVRPLATHGEESGTNTGFSLNTVALTDAANIAVDTSLGNTFTVTLGGNRNLSAPTNPTDGQKVVLRIIQDATGGRTLSFDSIYRFGLDILSITLSTGANKTDYIGIIYNGVDSKWDVVAVSKGF